MHHNVVGLSTRLDGIVEFELQRGNSIERIDRPAGWNCPLAVIFRMPLDIVGFQAVAGIPSGVRTWQNRDTHYPLETGYVCEQTNHAIAGPTAAL
jgi:hypothetical protein